MLLGVSLGYCLVDSIRVKLSQVTCMPTATAMLSPEIVESALQVDDGRAIFERACRRYLKMSTEEFLGKWNGHFFESHPELAHKAADVALLLPLLSAR